MSEKQYSSTIPASKFVVRCLFQGKLCILGKYNLPHTDKSFIWKIICACASNVYQGSPRGKGVRGRSLGMRLTVHMATQFSWHFISTIFEVEQACRTER